MSKSIITIHAKLRTKKKRQDKHDCRWLSDETHVCQASYSALLCSLSTLHQSATSPITSLLTTFGYIWRYVRLTLRTGWRCWRTVRLCRAVHGIERTDCCWIPTSPSPSAWEPLLDYARHPQPWVDSVSVARLRYSSARRFVPSAWSLTDVWRLKATLHQLSSQPIVIATTSLVAYSSDAILYG